MTCPSLAEILQLIAVAYAQTHSLDSFVIAGLDPAIHTQPAPAFRVDARIESGHDKQAYAPFACTSLA
jgi:hypothetical protein